MEMKCSFSLASERLCSGHIKPVVALNNIIQQYDSTSTEAELLKYRGCFFDTDINQLTICDVHYEQFWRRWRPFKYCILNIACKKSRAHERSCISVEQCQYLYENEGVSIPVGSGMITFIFNN